MNTTELVKLAAADPDHLTIEELRARRRAATLLGMFAEAATILRAETDRIAGVEARPCPHCGKSPGRRYDFSRMPISGHY